MSKPTDRETQGLRLSRRRAQDAPKVDGSSSLSGSGGLKPLPAWRQGTFSPRKAEGLSVGAEGWASQVVTEPGGHKIDQLEPSVRLRELTAK